MVRPCYLVVDREYSGNISTRKLVIETAKFNVLTAYSSAEAVETLRVFPACAAAVIDVGVDDIHCDELVRILKEIKPGMPVIAITGIGRECTPADFQLTSFEPSELLALLRKLDQEACDAIEAREQQLHAEGK